MRYFSIFSPKKFLATKNARFLRVFFRVFFQKRAGKKNFLAVYKIFLPVFDRKTAVFRKQKTRKNFSKINEKNCTKTAKSEQKIGVFL